MLHGGLLRNRIHLIEGRPGTGKTTLGLRYLIEGVASDDAGLYLSLSEAEDELRATAANHGWNLDGVEIVDMIPLPPQPAPQSILLPTDSELAELVNRIADRVEQARPARVVIDSMVEIRLLARDSAHYRRQIIALRERLSRIGATVLLLDDITSDGREYELQSAVHGVISLEYVERSFGAARRRLHVVKMRGGSFQSGWHDYKILPGEILVFPSLIAQEHHRPPQRNDIVSGIATLDELAGGPLVAGSSTMVLGPSGVARPRWRSSMRCRRSGRACGSLTSTSTNPSRRCVRAWSRTWAKGRSGTSTPATPAPAMQRTRTTIAASSCAASIRHASRPVNSSGTCGAWSKTTTSGW